MRSRSQPCSRLLPAARPRSSRDKHALHAPHTYTRQARPPRAPHLYQTSTPSTRPTPTPHSPHAHCRRAAAHQHVCRGAVPGDDVDVAVVGRHRQHRLALRGARGGAAGRPGQARGTAQARRRGCTKQGRPAAAPGSSGGCCPPPPRLRLPPPPLTPPAPACPRCARSCPPRRRQTPSPRWGSTAGPQQTTRGPCVHAARRRGG